MSNIFPASTHRERDNAAKANLLSHRDVMSFMRCKSRIEHALDVWMRREKSCDGERVLFMLSNAERQRLDAAQHKPRVERLRCCSVSVRKKLDAFVQFVRSSDDRAANN